jgi:hypothetical protein
MLFQHDGAPSPTSRTKCVIGSTTIFRTHGSAVGALSSSLHGLLITANLRFFLVRRKQDGDNLIPRILTVSTDIRGQPRQLVRVNVAVKHACCLEEVI